jgi:hypothetical protein
MPPVCSPTRSQELGVYSISDQRPALGVRFGRIWFRTRLDKTPKLRVCGTGRDQKKMNIENEGESHDVVDNKGSIFRTHDVIDNKGSCRG